MSALVLGPEASEGLRTLAADFSAGRKAALARALVEVIAALEALRAPAAGEGEGQSPNAQLAAVLRDVLGEPGAATRLHEALKKRQILVKNVSTMHPLLANCLRLTVGTAPENTLLLAALEASL